MFTIYVLRLVNCPSLNNLGPLLAILGDLGPILGASGANLGPSWAILGPSWAPLGHVGARTGLYAARNDSLRTAMLRVATTAGQPLPGICGICTVAPYASLNRQGNPSSLLYKLSTYALALRFIVMYTLVAK